VREFRKNFTLALLEQACRLRKQHFFLGRGKLLEFRLEVKSLLVLAD
jgi:hypothetical protein